MTKPFRAYSVSGLLILFFTFCTYQLSAATITAKATGNWGDAATWNGGAVPGFADDVVIQGNFVVTVTVNAACASLRIEGLDTDAGDAVLVINPGITLTVTTNVDIRAGQSGGNDFNARLTNNGNLSIGGYLNLNSSEGAQYGFCYFDQGAGTTNITGNVILSGLSTSQNSNINFTGTGTFNLNGPSSTLTLNSNSNLNYNAVAGTIVAGNGTTVNIAGGVFNMGTSGTLKLSGTLTNGGTFTKGTGTVIYEGSGNQTITALNYHNLTFAGTGTRTISGTVGVSGTFTKGTNTCTITGSTFNFNGTGTQTVPAFQYNNLTISGARTTNKVTLDNTDTIKLFGTISNTSTYTTGSLVNTGNVICYNSTAAQTIAAFPYNDLTVNKPKDVLATTTNGNVAIGGNCTVISGVLQIGSGQPSIGQTAEYTFSGNAASSTIEVKDGAQLNILGTTTNPASFPKTRWKNFVFSPNSIVNYNSTGAQTITDLQYGILTCSASGTRTLSATGTIKVSNTFTPGASTYTVTGSTVEFNGTIPQTIPAFNYNSLTVTNAATNITLPSTGTIGIAGTFTPNSTTFFKTTGSTINYNGTGAQTVVAFDYNNLTVSGSRAANSVTLSPTSLIQVAGTLVNSSTYSGTGGIINTGSTVVYNGTTAQTVIDFPYNNLTINKPSGPAATLAANLTATNLKGNLSVEKDTLSTANFTITGSANKALSVSAVGVLHISGTTATFPTGFSTFALDPKSYVVYSSTAAQTIGAVNYGYLKSTSTGARTLAATGSIGVASDFISGTNTYTSTGSTVEFNGTADQQLSGNLGTTNAFNNLNINNTGTLASNGLKLSTNITVGGVVNMKEGQLILNGKTLIVTNSAIGAMIRTNGVIISENTDNNSKVQWNIGTTIGEHVIPFGKSVTEYVPFKLNLTSGDASNITVSTYGTSTTNEPLPVSPAVTNIDQQGPTDASNSVVDRFWNVSASTTAARTATLSFDFLASEIPSTSSTLRVQSWNGTGWDAALNNQTASASSVTVPNVTAFGTFAIYDNTVPVVAFSANTLESCAGKNIQFTDNSLPAASSWNWSFPGGTPSTSTEKNPVVTYAGNGLYDVTLKVTNRFGSATLTKPAYISIISANAPNVTNNGPVCSGNSIALTAEGAPGATYYWTGPNGYTSNVQNPVIPSASTTQAGTYSVISKYNGCSSAVATTTVSVNQTINTSVSIASNSSSENYCTGNELKYTATPVNGGATPHYQWIINGENVGTDSPTYTGPTTGLNNVNGIYCTMTSSVVCPKSPSVTSPASTFFVDQTVTPTVEVSGDNSICSGSAVSFTATITNGGPNPKYQWTVDGINVGTNSKTFSSSALTNGNKVSCTLTSDAVCATSVNTTSTPIDMTVTQNVTPGVSIDITSGTNPLCSGESVTFTATAVDGGENATYEWKVNNVSYGVLNNTFTYPYFANNDKVVCVLTSSKECVTSAKASSPATTMTVNAIPIKPIISQGGLGVVLTSSSAEGNQWYKGGTIITSATDRTYTATENDAYTVIVTLNGCSSASSDPVFVSNVSVGELNKSEVLRVGPNPTNGIINIYQLSATQEPFSIKIYNAIGELIFTGDQSNSELDITSKAAGIYTLHLEGADFSLSQKIIKQ